MVAVKSVALTRRNGPAGTVNVTEVPVPTRNVSSTRSERVFSRKTDSRADAAVTRERHCGRDIKARRNAERINEQRAGTVRDIDDGGRAVLDAAA